MSKFLSAVGVAGGIFVGACNNCGTHGGPPVPGDPPPPASPDVEEPDGEGELEAFSLPKHDWNGLETMTTESQVRSTLRDIGFDVVPARGKTFITYDTFRQIVHEREKTVDIPSMVFMETERKERVLKNVWGVKLVFHKNRLVQFSPQYFSSPVELVEPDDEYVSVDDMERKLKALFGPPNVLDEPIKVVYPGEKGSVEEHACIWSDDVMRIVYRRVNDSGIVRHAMTFSSPNAMRAVEKNLIRFLETRSKKTELDSLSF